MTKKEIVNMVLYGNKEGKVSINIANIPASDDDILEENELDFATELDNDEIEEEYIKRLEKEKKEDEFNDKLTRLRQKYPTYPFFNNVSCDTDLDKLEMDAFMYDMM